MATLTELNCVCGWREQGMGEVGGGGGQVCFPFYNSVN